MNHRLFLIALLAALLMLVVVAAPTAADDLITVEEGTSITGESPPDGIEGVGWRYDFASSLGTYTEITGGTVHGTTSNDDTSFNAIPLGFTFTFDGVGYTQASIQSNGFIAMGPTVTSSYVPISGGTSNNVIAALGRDLQGNGTTSELMSLTEGTEPNRVFTVQWKSYKRYGSSYVGDDFNFQIKLHETSNLVEIVYGPFTAIYNAAPPTIQVGLRGTSNADYNNRMTDATHDWSNSLPGTTNASYMDLTDTIYPPSGLTYSWPFAVGLFVSPDAQSGSACPGSDVTYQIEVANQTGAPLSFDLDYDSVWPVYGPATTGVIANNESEILDVTVHIPWAANAGDSDVLTVTAADATDTYTDTGTATTTAALFGGYTDYANSPAGRGVRLPSVVYWDGKLYKIGGYNVSAQPWLDIYDIATDTWSQGADMPAGRYWLNCEAIDAKIYCAGGYLSSAQTTLYIYDIAAGTWSTGANPLPVARYDYASAQLGGKYYLIGGYAGGVTATMIAYDPVSDTWDTSLPSMSVARRYAPAAGVIGGKIYVAGGYSTTYLSSAEVYDPVANTWSPVASMPSTWLNSADGVLHDRYLVLTGGAASSSSAASNGALIYDAVEDAWDWLPLFNHMVYGAEGDGDGSSYWTVSGRLYENGVWGYSEYTTLLDECFECVPVTVADFTVDPAVPRPGIPATFTGTANGSPPFTFDWDFDDGGTGSGQVIQHSFATPSTYGVEMIAANCDGTSSVAVTHDVIVEAGASIVVDPLALDSTQCPDCQMTYTLSICNEGDQALLYSFAESLPWLSQDPASGSVPSAGCVDVDVIFDSTGMAPDTYTGTLQVLSNDALNPVVDVDVSLTVAGGPTDAAFTFDPAVPWIDETVTFNATANALLPIDYTWDFGDGTTGAGQSVSHAYAAAGDYTVVMTATVCDEIAVVTHIVSVPTCWSVIDEHFETAFPPADWTVINNGGTCVWQRNDQVPSGRPNYAGGDGYCADADVDRCGSGTTMNTELRTMVLDLTGMTTATLDYMAAYNWMSSSEWANTDISTDGGATWTNLLHWNTDHSPSGPGEPVSLDLTPYAGQTNVMVRFHYYAPGWYYYWEVDQVRVGGCYIEGAAPEIVVTPTELEQTLYPDQAADQAFNIANIGLVALDWTLDEGCGTPVDWLSLDPPAGTTPVAGDADVTVSFDSTGLAVGTYETTVCVDSNDPVSPTVVVEVTLIVTGAPEIAVTPPSLHSMQPPDVQVTLPLTICNVGAAPLTWSMAEAGRSVYLTGGALPIDAISIPEQPAGPAIGETGVPSGSPVEGTPASTIRPEDIGDAWEVMAPMPSARVFNAVVASGSYVYVIGGTSDAGGLTPTNTNFRYNTADNTWATMAPMPAALDSIDGIAIGGMIYIPGSDPDNNTYVYDTAADTWAAIPANGGYAAPAQYQVVAIGTDLYVLGGIIGGASTTNVWILDTTTGTWSAGVPMQKSRTSFSAAAIGGNIYVAGGVLYPGFTPDMTAEMFDGAAWSYIAPVPSGGGAYTRWSYNADGMAPGALWLAGGRRDLNWNVLNHAGFYDVATDTWTDSPTIPVMNQGRVYMEGAVASDGYFYVIGGRDSAASLVYDTNERLMVYSPDVEWLSEDPISGTLDIGLCEVVDVTFDSTGLELGEYYADLLIDSNDPYIPQVVVPVTLTVGIPDVFVEPVELAAELCADTTEILTFSICNTGTIPLEWLVYEMPVAGKVVSPAPVLLQTGGLTERPAVLPELVGSADAATAAPPTHIDATVLWDQPATMTNGGISDYFANLGAGAFSADDFMVSAPNAWDIETIFVDGFINSGVITDVLDLNWLIYPDAGGQPAGYPGDGSGAEVWSLTLLPTDTAVILGDDHVTLDIVAATGGVVSLPPGHYWLVFFPSMNYGTMNPWYWYGADPQLEVSMLIDPADLFGAGFTSWTPWDQAGVTTAFAFRLEGETMDIPWLSEDPVAGTVQPGECQDVEVTFDSTGMTPGDYAAALLLQSNDPDTPEVTIPVTMTVLEPASIVTVTYVITDLEVTFDATAAGAEPLTYAWDFGDDGTSADEDPIHAYAAGGCYDVSLTVSNGCGEDTWTEQICVCEPVSGLDFSWLPAMPAVDEEILFTATALGTDPTFTWNFGDGGVGTGITATHVYTAAGDYVVTLTATNCDGATAVMTDTVTVAEAPVTMWRVFLPVVMKGNQP